MTQRKGTQTQPKDEPTKEAPEESGPQWEEDDNGTCFTHTADDGRHYIALVLDDGSYAVTVTAGGAVLYSTRAANEAALNELVA